MEKDPLHIKKLITEIREIFADALAGRDLSTIEHRLSIAATKLDALADASPVNCATGAVKEIQSLRFLVSTLDAVRQSIGTNPDKAHYYIKAMQALANDDLPAAQEAIDEFTVRDFLSSLS